MLRILVGRSARFAWLAVIALVALELTGGPRGSGADEALRPASAKLSTVLADMARAVRPQPSSAPAVRGAPAAGFSLASMPKSVRDAARARVLRVNPQGEVQVYIMMNPVTDERVRELSARGASIEIVDTAGRRVQARVPVGRLEELAGLPFVTHIRPPFYARRMALTEGDAILRSDLARTQFGLSGAGVRVGVISDGIKGVFATGCTTCGGAAGGPISTGDLPSATGTRSIFGVLTASSGGINGRSFSADNDLEGIIPGCGFAGAGAEGTALLEIVHDIAPGAQLSFANIDTDAAMIQAVNTLAASNDVVVDDLGFLGLPSDGTSGVSSNTAAALNNSSNRIRGYYTSVGNGADNHYFGLYANSGVNGTTINGITTGGNLHEFESSAETSDTLGLGPQPHNLILLPPNGEVIVVLNWNDPFGASTNNYDLYLVRDSTNQVVDRSTDVQGVTGFPVEIISYTNDTLSEDFFRIVVQNVGNAAAARNLNLFAFEPQCAVDGPRLLAPPSHARLNFTTPTRSLSAQSDAGGSPVSVVSVGAICSASQRTQDLFAGSAAPFESCFDTTNETLEFFSAQGPTLDGRLKPDVASIDGVSITGAGNFPCPFDVPNCSSPFFGTSAAAPHVAAMAALVLESAPCLISGKPGALDIVTARTTLRNLILDHAVPLGGTIPNNMFGHGRADALASIEQTLPTFGGVSSITVSGNMPGGVNLSPAQLGFSDPNSCLLTTLIWTGGCGTGPGATMPCPFGTNNVSIGASNNGVSFSPVSDVQILVTNFVISVAPATQETVAGVAIRYTVSVEPQGGPYTNSVAFACGNLPAESSCAFNPPAITPGASPATSELTITTTARPAAASVHFPPPSGRNPTAPLIVLCLLLAGCAAFVAQDAAIRLAAMVSHSHRKKIPAPPAIQPRWRRNVAAAPVIAVALMAWLAVQNSCGASVTPTPASPSARLTPASLTFDPQGVGTTSSAKAATLSNTGNATLTISGITTSGEFGQTNNCGASLAAGASCTIDVTFTPTAGGERSGTLTVTSNATTRTTTLSGTGLAGTAAGSYTINVTGTAGTLTNSGSLTLVVQ